MSARVDVRVCLGLQTVSTNSQAIEISARKGIMPKDMTYSKILRTLESKVWRDIFGEMAEEEQNKLTAILLH